MDVAGVLDPASDTGPLPKDDQEQPTHDVSSVISNAVMHVAMSWVACCLEKTAESVEVTPLGGGIFDAMVRLSAGKEFWLRG